MILKLKAILAVGEASITGSLQFGCYEYSTTGAACINCKSPHPHYYFILLNGTTTVFLLNWRSGPSLQVDLHPNYVKMNVLHITNSHVQLSAALLLYATCW